MKSLLFEISLLGVALEGRVSAVEPTCELGETIARRLIGEVFDIPPNGINVSSIIDGKSIPVTVS